MLRNVPSRNFSWMLLSGKGAIPIPPSIARFGQSCCRLPSLEHPRGQLMASWRAGKWVNESRLHVISPRLQF
jgi:hypothetical protein